LPHVATTASTDPATRISSGFPLGFLNHSTRTNYMIHRLVSFSRRSILRLAAHFVTSVRTCLV
jgi:hypothetical protein